MLLPGPNGAKSARPTQLPTIPATRNGRRRPFARRTRSESAPATGAMTNAMTAPIARIEPLIPSFAAAFGPSIAAIWSGMMTGTTVSQLAKSANHNSDTAIWSATGNRGVRPIAAEVAAAAPNRSLIFLPSVVLVKYGDQPWSIPHRSIPPGGSNRLARCR